MLTDIVLPKGTTFAYGTLTFEKLGDKECDWWVCLTSTYPVEYINENNQLQYKATPESEKPLYDDKGRLNRYGFKWTDEEIKRYFKLI